MSPTVYLDSTDWTADQIYLYLSPVKHQPAQVWKFGDVGESLWVEAVAGRQIELLQRGTSQGDDLYTGFIQEVTAGQFQADQTETTGPQKAEEREGDISGKKKINESNFLFCLYFTFNSN